MAASDPRHEHDALIDRVATVAAATTPHPRLSHDEAAQEARIAAWQACQVWEDGHGATRATFAARWAKLAIRRAAINEWRKACGRQGQRQVVSGVPDRADPAPDPETVAVTRDRAERVAARLDPAQRVIVELLAAGLSQREAATVVGLSESRVCQILGPVRR